MADRIIMSALFFLIFCGYGFLNIRFTEFMIKTTASNTYKKKVTKAMVKRYKIGGYLFVVFGLRLIVFTFVSLSVRNSRLLAGPH